MFWLLIPPNILSLKKKCQDWVNFNVFESFPQQIKFSHRYRMLSLDHLNTPHKDRTVGTNIPKVNDKHMNFPRDIFIML